MTDDVFETRLRSQVARYAEGGVRPIDARAIAFATIATRTGRGWGFAGRDRATTRFGLLVGAALLIIAAAVAIVTIGRQTKPPTDLSDQPAPSAVVPSAPAPSVPVPSAVVAATQERIAYLQAGDVYVAAADGADAVKVLDDPGIDFTNVRWLSDGRHVAVDGAGVATVVDLTTGEHRRLDMPRDSLLAWRPGTDVVATVLGPTTRDDPAQLVLIDALAGTRTTFAVDRGLYGLAWSADGSRLGGQRWSATDESGSDLVSIDPETGLTTVVATATGYPEQIAWSPDLTQIAFVKDSDTGCDGVADKTCPTSADIDVVDTTAEAGKAPTKIAGPLPQVQPDGNNHSKPLGPRPIPTWSPDGTWIAYRTVTGLTLVHPDGTAGKDLPIGHVGPFTWDADGAGITAIVMETLDGTDGVATHVDVATGTTQAAGPSGIEQLTPTSVGPAIDHTWDTGTDASGSGPVAPAASPSAAPDAPTSHRMLALWRSDCGYHALVIDLDDGTADQVGPCGVDRVAADGRHLIADQVAIDLITGASTPITGRHEASPTGRWLITPPTDGDYRTSAGTTWDVATWDGTVRYRIPHPWGSPGNGPWSPAWSEDDGTVTVRTEHDTIRVDLTTGEQTILPDPGLEWWRYSTDGRPVVFTRDGDAWVAMGDGSEPQNLSRFPFGGAEDAWLLPDGATVAVLQGQRMWMIGLDGDRRSFGVESIEAPYDTRSIDWSPDRLWFAVSLSNENDDRVLRHTWFYTVEGALLGEAEGGDIAWSPDSRYAAVSVNPWDIKPTHTTAPIPAPPGRLAIVGVDGQTAKVAKAWGARWSPDSSQLAVFTAAKKGSPTHLQVMAPDGTDRQTVSTKAVGSVTWIPDR